MNIQNNVAIGTQIIKGNPQFCIMKEEGMYGVYKCKVMREYKCTINGLGVKNCEAWVDIQDNGYDGFKLVNYLYDNEREAISSLMKNDIFHKQV